MTRSLTSGWTPAAARIAFYLATGISSAIPALAQPAFNAAPNPTPPIHEAFDYSIEWRLITAGKAHLEWNTFPSVGPEAGEVKLHVESTGIVSRLFLVNDDYSAFLAPGFCAQNSIIQAQEGSRHKETRVNYDYTAHKATYSEKDLTKNTTVNQEVAIPACTHDLIGGLISLRSLHLEPGKTAQVPVSDGKKSVMAKVESQRKEVLKTNFGPVNTVLYEIYLFDNVLFRKSGHLHVWITDDERRLPVQLQVRLQFAIGTITFKMEKPATANALAGGK